MCTDCHFPFPISSQLANMSNPCKPIPESRYSVPENKEASPAQDKERGHMQVRYHFSRQCDASRCCNPNAALGIVMMQCKVEKEK